MKITGSLSLKFFKEEELGGSLSLQHLKNPNQQFFKNSKSHPTMVCVLSIRFLLLWQILAISWQMFWDEVLDKSVLQCNFH
jgi:hypothetical protein